MLEMTLEFLRRAAILAPAAPGEPERFAAGELRRYLHRMTGVAPEVRAATQIAPCSLLLAAAGAEQGPARQTCPDHGYEIVVADERITLAAASGRSLLDAVYALLAQLGCAWSLHGDEEEHVPTLTADKVRVAPIRHAAAFRVHGYCSDIMTWHYTQPEQFHARLDDDRRFIDWMGKSGANSFFFIRHPHDTQLTIPELLPDFARRGIDVEYGGHVLPLLLPRELFAEHPDYFPANADGGRSDNGNLCPSSPGALAAVRANAAAYVRDYPEMSGLHVWGADLLQGGWCRCAGCRTLTVQDQSLRVCNAVADGLAEAGLRRPVFYLAYHDSIDATLTERPGPDVVCEFAPRERCYAHALNDPSCTTNRRYATALERYVQLFAGRVRLFEYYGDAILFFGCALPLTEVIAADMAYYRSLGIRDALMLQFGQFSVWAYPLNFLAFAAACDGRAAAGVPSAYCARFGAEHAAAQRAFTQLESVLRAVVNYGDIRLKPRDAAIARQLQGNLATALPQLGDLAARLETATSSALRSHATLVRYTQGVLAGIDHEIRTGASGDAIYADALRLMETVERRTKGLWGEVDLPIIHSFYSAAALMGFGSNPS